MLVKLCDAWLEQRHESLTVAALLRRDVINYSFCRPKEPVKLDDLLPPLPKRRRSSGARGRLGRKQREEIAHGFRRFFAAQNEA
jgi:hypothetical protein